MQSKTFNQFHDVVFLIDDKKTLSATIRVYAFDLVPFSFLVQMEIHYGSQFNKRFQ